MIVSADNKKYCNIYNRNSLKGKIYLRLKMVNWATKQYDFWKPVKDKYWKIGWYFYDKDMLNLDIDENASLPNYWFKYFKI